MLTANQIEKALRQDVTPQEDSGGAFGLLCGLFMSLVLTALLALGVCQFFGGPAGHEPPVMAGVVLTSWVLAYLIGGAVKDQVDLSDSVSRSNTYSEEDQGQADGFGCVLALLQFIFGNIYVCIQALLGRSGPAISPLATPVLTLLANRPGDTLTLSDIFSQLQAAGVDSKPKRLRKALAWLVKENWLLGTENTGYRVNATRLQLLQ